MRPEVFQQFVDLNDKFSFACGVIRCRHDKVSVEDMEALLEKDKLVSFCRQYSEITKINEMTYPGPAKIGIASSEAVFERIPRPVSKEGSFWGENVFLLGFPNSRLTSIPDEICNLKNLRDLCLSGNQIEDVSPCLGRLSLLMHLDLRNNEISYLSPSLTRLKCLQVFHLDGNPRLLEKLTLKFRHEASKFLT